MTTYLLGWIVGCIGSAAYDALRGNYARSWIGVISSLPALLVLSFVSQ